MIVQSPLKKRNVRPNLRKVELPKKSAKSSGSSVRRSYASTPEPKNALKFQPWKVIVASIFIGFTGLFYLTHTFTTQKLLNEVQLLDAEYNKIRTHYDALKLQYQRMIGPAEIYRKAEAQGFINGGPADKIIIIED